MHTVPLSFVLTSFIDLVCHVLGLVPQEQMVRSDASRIIAKVQNVFGRPKSAAEFDHHRDAMRSGLDKSSGSACENTIAAPPLECVRGPLPATNFRIGVAFAE